MKPTNIYDFTIAPGATYNLLVAGEYFKILQSTGLLDVVSDFGRLGPIGTGQGLEDTAFSRLTLTDKSGAVNAVRLVIGDRNFIDGVNGSVVVTQGSSARSGLFTSAALTVTSASTTALPANLIRQYLAIQNNHPTSAVYVNLSGAAATAVNGLRIIPGGVLEMSNIVPTGAVTVIGDVASNVACVIVEG